jgi:hypothetical protein
MTPRDQLRDLRAALPEEAGSPAIGGPAPWSARLRARWFANRYDREIEGGLGAVPGSPLAVHGVRLTSARERDALARALRLVLHDADAGGRRRTVRVPLHRGAVRRGADLIGAVCDRLDDPFPVRARGMARLRILLADGRGPLYRSGPGTLTAALRGVLAAL